MGPRLKTFLRDLFALAFLGELCYLGVRGYMEPWSQCRVRLHGPNSAWQGSVDVSYGPRVHSPELVSGEWPQINGTADWNPSHPSGCVSGAITYIAGMVLLGIHVPAWVLVHRLDLDGHELDLWFGPMIFFGVGLTTLSYFEWGLDCHRPFPQGFSAETFHIVGTVEVDPPTWTSVFYTVVATLVGFVGVVVGIIILRYVRRVRRGQSVQPAQPAHWVSPAIIGESDITIP